jgi:ribosomal protein L7/L12
LIIMIILANMTSLLKNVHHKDKIFDKGEMSLPTQAGEEKTDMTGTKYHVRFTGRLQSGLSQEDVVKNLEKLTNLGREKAESLLSSEKPLVLKKDVDLETAEKYRKVFEKAGMMIQVVPAGTTQQIPPVPEKMKPVPSSVQPPQNPPPHAAPGAVPEEGKNVVENPYAAPKADLKVPRENKKGMWLDEPRKVPALHGWYWLQSAVSMFVEQPWIWMGMGLIIFVSTLILSLVPFAGPFCSFMLMVVLNGGLMLAAQAQIEGKKVTIGHIFQGFNESPGQLLLVGLFYLLFFFAFGILIGGIIFAIIFSGLHSANMANFPIFLRSHILLIILLFLLSLLLTVPLVMAYWFAPSLVALTGKTAWNAYKLSFRGCQRNWAPFLIYGLAVLVVGILLMLVISAMGMLFVFISQGGTFLVAFLPIILYALIGIPIASILGLTIFTGFRDIYYQSA